MQQKELVGLIELLLETNVLTWCCIAFDAFSAIILTIEFIIGMNLLHLVYHQDVVSFDRHCEVRYCTSVLHLNVYMGLFNAEFECWLALVDYLNCEIIDFDGDIQWFSH